VAHGSSDLPPPPSKPGHRWVPASSATDTGPRVPRPSLSLGSGQAGLSAARASCWGQCAAGPLGSYMTILDDDVQELHDDVADKEHEKAFNARPDIPTEDSGFYIKVF
jgi:hypothetical protein